VLGRAFHELGLIERWGSGIQRMTTACREAGLAPPTLEEIGTRFRVTLWLRPNGVSWPTRSTPPRRTTPGCSSKS
jgi:predicted HTH transcriptional regulator